MDRYVIHFRNNRTGEPGTLAGRYSLGMATKRRDQLNAAFSWITHWIELVR